MDNNLEKEMRLRSPRYDQIPEDGSHNEEKPNVFRDQGMDQV